MAGTPGRYRSLSSWLKEIFGAPVRKIALDAGLGCPNRDGTKSVDGCIYCNPRGSGTGALRQGIDLEGQVDNGIKFLSQRYGCKKFIAYFQSFTNTYAAPEALADLYNQALARPEVVGLAVGTRPDCVPDDVLEVLARIGRDHLVWVEYGLQSAYDETLRFLNRGHDAAAFFDAVDRTRVRGILSVAHLILGLPGETRADMLETARAVARSGVHGVKLHPLYVVKGTRLEQIYREGQWRPFSEDEAIDATLSVLEVLPYEMVIHRTTSDPHPEELVAPHWMLNKRKVRDHLSQEMERRDFKQGTHCHRVEN